MMKLHSIKLISAFLLFCSFLTSTAQERCRTDKYMQERFQADPLLEKTFQDRQQQFVKEMNKRIACTSDDEVSIPLAFHFDNSVSCADEACILSTIQDQIDIMNIAFGDNTSSPNAANCTAAYPDISSGTCITFYLAEPPSCADQSTTACNAAITIGEFNNGGYANSANGGAGTCWDDYLNVFILPNIGFLGVSDQIPDDLPPDGPGEGVTVESSVFGGLNGPCSPFDTNNQFGQGKTLVHEVGHYLGLFHTFEGGCSDEPNNSYNGTAINVDDTPAQSSDFGGCTSTCVSSGCGGGTFQQTANFMNYTDDDCMDMFSEDQAFVQNLVALDLFGSLSIPIADISGGDLFGLCPAGQCVLVCPSTVTSPIAIVDDFCDDSGMITLNSAGLILDDASDAVYLWSTGDYISNGGSLITSSTVGPITTMDCTVTSQVYYLNIDCGTTPLATTLEGGTYTINVYPGPPADLSTLVIISGENTCDEPIITPIQNCSDYITITPDPANPIFPVANGMMGVSSSTIDYVPDPAGPACCASLGGELVINGDFESGNAPWTQVEEAPIGTPNPFGIIGTSDELLNGTTDAWFGGWGSVTGFGSVLSSFMTLTQNLTLSPACNTAILSFDYLVTCEANATIIFNVIVGGVTVGTLDCSSNTGTFSLELIGAGVPTGPVDLVFESTESDPNPRNDEDSANVFIDNVSIVESCPTSTCNVVVTADYDCSGISGCTDPTAHNYDPLATIDDNACETCSDGVLNGDETEIDCGGANPACPTCPCPTCYTDLTHGSGCDLQTVESGTIDYESSNWIETSASTVIETGAIVDYDATDYIEINGSKNHTFEVQLGATFHMFIDGCGGNMIQNGNLDSKD